MTTVAAVIMAVAVIGMAADITITVVAIIIAMAAVTTAGTGAVRHIITAAPTTTMTAPTMTTDIRPTAMVMRQA